MELFDKIKKGLFLMSLCFICLGQTVAQSVAKIGIDEYATLQDAVDAAYATTGDVTIELMANTSEIVIICQKPDLGITVNGQNYTLTGQIIVNYGRNTTDNTASLLIENLNFVYDENYYNTAVGPYFIAVPTNPSTVPWHDCYPSYTGHYNDSHNITVQNCTFDGDGSGNSVAAFYVASNTNDVRNIKLDNLVVKNAHSLAQFNGTNGITITNCTATENVKNGINITGGKNGINISNNTITTLTDGNTQYGIRIKGGSSELKTANLSGNAITAPSAILLSNSAPDKTVINITSGSYIGDVVTDASEITITGGTYSDADITPEIAYGYTLEANGNGTYSVDRLEVAQIGTTTYPSLQDALDTAHTKTGDVTIELLKNIEGYYIVHQKAGLNITIEGNNDTIAGQIAIDGDARAAGTETITINNVRFVGNQSNFYSTVSDDNAFILVPTLKTSGKPWYTGGYNYAHNITANNCTFTSTSSGIDVVAVRVNSGAGAYNIVINGCTGDNLHSLAQLTGTTGATFTNCKVPNGDSFINVSGGGGDYVITDCKFISSLTDGYGIRDKDGSSVIFTIERDTITADKALVFGKSAEESPAPSGRMNVSSGVYAGTVSIIPTASTATFFFTGGTFTNLGGADDAADSTNVKAKCAEGYGCYKDVAGYPTGWTVLKMYWVTYDANGGSGTPMTPSYVAPIPGSSFTVKENEYDWNVDFTNWNTKADGTGDPYDENATMTISSDTTLYAQWDVVAKIGAIPYSSLQAAIDDANANMTGDVTINLMKNTSEVVTVLQKAENNLTINGNGNTLTGQMFISSNQGDIWNGTDKINITNLKFAYDENYFNLEGSTDYWKTDGFIVFCRNCFFTSNFNYAHNVTISDCEFDGAGSTQKIYAVKSGASGGVNKVVLENCTAKNVLGLAELQSTANFTVTGCTATENVDRGLYIAGSVGNHHITNNTITATEYAVHIQYQTTTGTTDSLSGNTFEAPVVFKLDHNESPNVTLDITSGTYKGTINDQDASTIFNITGGTYSEDVTGEPCAPGYAAFDNHDGTWTVAQAWFLYYDKNEPEAEGTMDTLFVRRDGTAAERTLKVAPCDFTWLPYHSFKEWNTKADGLGTTVAVGTNIELTSDTTLYVIWQEGNTIIYHNNGGSGTIANQYKAVDETITLSDGTGFTKTDSTLYRWNTTADEAAGSTDYALGASYSDNANLDLYAVWRLNLGMTSSATDVVCYGQNNGTDTVKIVGGEAPYKLVLSGGALETNQEVTTTETKYIFTDLKPSTTDYTVSLTDVLNATPITKTFTISEPQELLITSLTVPEKPCPLMGNGTYEVSMTTTGGNGGNTITWEGDAENVNALSTTVNSATDDRDKTYTVSVKVTDSKGCEATQTATFSVAPVIANDETTHSNTTMTIADVNKDIMYGCDTIIRDFGTPTFTFTNAAIDEHILDTVYNNVSTVAPDSVFPVGTTTITWTAVDTCGHTVTVEQKVVIGYLPCPKAIDGNTIEYQTVRVGCYCWMAENLRSTVYSDGSREIKNVMHYPSNTRAAEPGNLYDWYAVVDTATNSTDAIEAAYAAGNSVRGICPAGWHVPTEAETANLMSSTTTEDLMSDGSWVPDNGTGNSGFNMEPAGEYNSALDRYERKYVSAYFWVFTPATSVYHACEFGAACSTTELIPGSLTMGYSVRCVKDE